MGENQSQYRTSRSPRFLHAADAGLIPPIARDRAKTPKTADNDLRLINDNCVILDPPSLGTDIPDDG